MQQRDRAAEGVRGEDHRQLVRDAFDGDVGDAFGARCGSRSSVASSIVEIRIAPPSAPLSTSAADRRRNSRRRSCARGGASRSPRPSCGSSSSPDREIDGHGVDGEIAAGEIGVDAAVEQRGEIVDVRAVDDAIRAEMFFASEADDLAAQRAGAGERIETGHVDVGGSGAEDQIADGAADDVRVRGRSRRRGKRRRRSSRRVIAIADPRGTEYQVACARCALMATRRLRRSALTDHDTRLRNTPIPSISTSTRSPAVERADAGRGAGEDHVAGIRAS